MKHFVFKHWSEIHRWRGKILASKTLKKISLGLALKKGELAFDIFQSCWFRCWWSQVGIKWIPHCEGEYSAIRIGQLGIVYGHFFFCILFFSKEVTLLEVSSSSDVSAYTNSANSLRTSWTWESPLLWPGSLALFQSHSPCSHCSRVQQFSTDTDVVKKSWRTVLYKQ